MSNGKIDDAEIDALLTGDQRLVDRYLVTGIRELKTEVAAMRQVCETRGRMCPGMHANIADPVAPCPARSEGSETRGEAKTERKRFSREQIVANFWLLVGFFALSGVVNRIVDMLFKN